MKTITAKRYCEKCGSEQMVRLVRNIAQNGVSQIYWLCIAGEHPIGKNGASFISHEKVKSIVEPNDLPVVENYTGREVCAVCGSPLTELNHWAPRHLFGDECEKWPKDYLCDEHHKLWHRLVTPNMPGIKHG